MGGDQSVDPQQAAPSYPLVDPAWWRAALSSSEQPLELELISIKLREAASRGADEARSRVLSLLADTTSALLEPDDWSEPFRPMASVGGRRSILPSDLDQAQLSSLAAIADLLDPQDPAALRARVFDVCWLYREPRDIRMAQRAIEAYTEGSLADSERGGLRTGWSRGLDLAVRLRQVGIRDALRDRIIERLSQATVEDGFFAIDLCELLREFRLVGRDQAASFGERSVALAAAARSAGNPRLEQAWEEEAATWYTRAGLTDEACACVARMAESSAAEAALVRMDSGRAVAAEFHVEQALKFLSRLPRSYLKAQGLDRRLRELREELGEDRQTILESMTAVETEPVDISELVAAARRHVTGLEAEPALLAFASLWSGPSLSIRPSERHRYCG